MEKKTKIHNKFIEKRFSGNELKYLKEIKILVLNLMLNHQDYFLSLL